MFLSLVSCICIMRIILQLFWELNELMCVKAGSHCLAHSQCSINGNHNSINDACLSICSLQQLLKCTHFLKYKEHFSMWAWSLCILEEFLGMQPKTWLLCSMVLFAFLLPVAFLHSLSLCPTRTGAPFMYESMAKIWLNGRNEKEYSVCVASKGLWGRI